jgi:site-specific DNA recombinase
LRRSLWGNAGQGDSESPKTSLSLGVLAHLPAGLINRDGCWLISALNPFLQNERYAGRLVWNRRIWVKDPDSGRRLQRTRPQKDWIITECPALIDVATWNAVQQRFRERARALPTRSFRPRRYLLSGLLTCERCGSRLVVTSKPPRYACGTFLHGGGAACPVDATARLDAVESAILQPIKSELLSREAIEKFCSLIREWHQRENQELAHGSSPTADAIAAEIADLEVLIAQRPSRAATLGPAIEDLRQREANVRRAASRRAAASEIGLPDEAAYREAVADLNGALQGSNVEAARAALRSLVGNIPVFQTGRQLAARLTMNPAALMRNPAINW